MKTFLLVSFLCLAVLSSACQTREPVSTLDPLLCLENLEDPSLTVDQIESFTLSGPIQSREALAPFSGDPVTMIYLVAENDGSSAYTELYELAEKQDIDVIYDGELYVKLGVLDGSTLSSSAALSQARAAEILEALDSGETLVLRMLMAKTLGQGASVDSVHPCVID